MSDDVTQLTELFKNALVYTTIIRNVDSLIDDKDRSIIMIMLGSALAAAGATRATSYAKNEIKSSRSQFNESNTFGIIGKLGVFLLSTATNVLVQLTSSLASTLATAVFSSADSLPWGLAGAVVSIVLLWLLQETVKLN